MTIYDSAGFVYTEGPFKNKLIKNHDASDGRFVFDETTKLLSVTSDGADTYPAFDNSNPNNNPSYNNYYFQFHVNRGEIIELSGLVLPLNIDRDLTYESSAGNFQLIYQKRSASEGIIQGDSNIDPETGQRVYYEMQFEAIEDPNYSNQYTITPYDITVYTGNDETPGEYITVDARSSNQVYINVFFGDDPFFSLSSNSSNVNRFWYSTASSSSINASYAQGTLSISFTSDANENAVTNNAFWEGLWDDSNTHNVGYIPPVRPPNIDIGKTATLKVRVTSITKMILGEFNEVISSEPSSGACVRMTCNKDYSVRILGAGGGPIDIKKRLREFEVLA